MKKSIFSGGFFVLAILFCLSATDFTVQARLPINQSHDSALNVSVTDEGQCVHLGKFLQEEFAKNSKPLKGSPEIRIVGVQEKDAIVKALNLCIKLKASEIKSNGNDLIYDLPDGLGSIIIQEIKNDDVFRKVKLITGCEKLPFVEIWYVSLKFYNKG